jgi:hypothetical protein
MQARKALRLHAIDNVAVVLEDVHAGDGLVILGGGTRASIEARQAIPFAHKIALGTVDDGAAIVKYGVPIGFATRRIESGEWVHCDNVGSYCAARRRGNTS